MGMDASLPTGASVLTACQAPGGGGGGGAVTQITAGTAITVSPAGGTGNVTINNVGATSVGSSDSFITASPGTGAVGLGQRIVANWDPTIWAVYAVDYDAGNDANAGVALPASSSLADFQAAVVSAGAVAKKTMQGLGAILPVDGNGRQAIVFIAARSGGASYLKQDGVTVDSLDSFMSGRDGYTNLYIWATGTNPTAGATKFTGTANDLTYAGAIPVPGTNNAGYNPTGAATAATVPCLQVGGAAPAFAAEPLAPLGYRARYDNATSTAGLRNICRSTQIVSTTTTTRDTVSPETNWPAVPAAADVFYLEQPGVVCNGWGNGWGAANARVLIVGVRSLTVVNYLTGPLSINRLVHMFCGVGGSTALGGAVGAATSFSGPSTLGTIRCGSTLHVAGNVLFQVGTPFAQQHSMVIEGTSLFEFQPGGVNDAGMVFGNRVQFQGGTGCLTANNPMIGNVSGGLPCRSLLGGVLVQGCRLNLKDFAITGAGANPGITVQGQAVLFLEGTSGSTGNTDVGLDLTGSQGSLIVLNGANPTVTGTAGDIRLSNGTIVTWAEVGVSGIVDQAGNQIVATNAPARIIATLTGLLKSPGDGSSQSSFMANAGINVLNAINTNNTPSHYSTSLRFIRSMRVTLLTGQIFNQNVVFFLCKNASPVASGMGVVFTPGASSGSKGFDLIHPQLFLDGEDFDVLMTENGDTLGGSVIASVVLEGW